MPDEFTITPISFRGPGHRAPGRGIIAACVAGLALCTCSCTVQENTPEDESAPEPRVIKTEKATHDKLWVERDEDGSVAGLTPTRPTPTDNPRTQTNSGTPAKDLTANDIGQEVKRYILENARDPGSVDFVKWYPIAKFEDGYYLRCQYRTDGGSFGLISEDKVFYVNRSGKVYRTSARTPGGSNRTTP